MEACILPLTVSSLVRSQEEQFFINGKLPDFHQVDIPDIWIGLSGSQHAIPVLFPCFIPQKCPLSLTHSLWCSPDKDQDGHFRWVDKTEVTFSNYGPGWPKNTANIWDCGQIFTGESPVKHWAEAASQSQSTEVLFCCRKLWWHVGNHQLLQEPGLHLRDDRRAEPQAHYHAGSVRLLRIDEPHLC